MLSVTFCNWIQVDFKDKIHRDLISIFIIIINNVWQKGSRKNLWAYTSELTRATDYGSFVLPYYYKTTNPLDKGGILFRFFIVYERKNKCIPKRNGQGIAMDQVILCIGAG